MKDETRTVHVDPNRAADIVGTFLDRAGVERKPSYSFAEVADLAARLGYQCSPRVIIEFIGKNYMPDPGDHFDCVGIFCLIAALESRRRWGRTPNAHDGKKTQYRLQLEEVQNDGIDPPVRDLDRYTLEDLCIHLLTPPPLTTPRSPAERAVPDFAGYVDRLGLNVNALSAEQMAVARKAFDQCCADWAWREIHYEYLRLKLAGFEE